MASLTDNASYTPNEVYRISQADVVEGAAAGATFSGIGIDNQPHQQLANRTAWLYGQVQNLNAEVATLNTEVAAIQALMKRSAATALMVSPQPETIYPNGVQQLMLTQYFTFPTFAGISGYYNLMAFLTLQVSAAAGDPGNPVSLGGLYYSVYDLTNKIYIVRSTGSLLVTGNEGGADCIRDSGMSIFSDGTTPFYSPGQQINITVQVGLTGGAYPFASVYVASAVVQLYAFSA
jgi:hypothetical protein